MYRHNMKIIAWLKSMNGITVWTSEEENLVFQVVDIMKKLLINGFFC